MKITNNCWKKHFGKLKTTFSFDVLESIGYLGERIRNAYHKIQEEAQAKEDFFKGKEMKMYLPTNPKFSPFG